MFELIKAGWAATFPDVEFTKTSTEVEEFLLNHPTYGPAMNELSDEERNVYVQANMADILAALAGGTKAPATKKEAILPESFNNLTAVQQQAIDALMSKDADMKHARTVGSRIDALLIARDVPSEWIPSGLVATVKPKNKAAEAILGTEHYTSQPIFEWLRSATEGYIIPTTAQLAELAADHERKWKDAHVGSEANYTAPKWAKEDNDANVAALKTELQAQKPLSVLITGRTEDPATHANAWKWATKGYVVTYPTALEGEGSMETQSFSKDRFRTWLMNFTDGAIVVDTGDKTSLSAKILMTQRKLAKSETGVKKPDSVLRVRGDNVGNRDNLTLKPITSPNFEKKTTMTVKSALSFLIVRVVAGASNNPGNSVDYRVVRQRVSLEWKEAPTFEPVQEYRLIPGLFAGKSSGGRDLTGAKKNAVSDAVRNLFASALNGDMSPDDIKKYGLEGVVKDLNEYIASHNAADAAQFA